MEQKLQASYVKTKTDDTDNVMMPIINKINEK